MKVEVKYAKGMGLGVFAIRDIKASELIERCPVIQIPETEYDIIKHSILKWYVYDASNRGPNAVKLCLGYGSIYNHSDDPNVEWNGVNARYMNFHTMRNIKKGEQLFIDYGDDYWPKEGYND